MLAWLAAAAFLFAAAWPRYSEAPLPLLGLRQLANPLVGWPLALATLVMALLLSIAKFRSRERLLISAGFAFCLFAVTAFYASPAAAVIYVFIGASLVRESRY